MSESVYLTKHVVAVRSARHKHWVAAIAGQSIYHSERMMCMLYESVASSDYTARVRIPINMSRLKSEDEESAS